MIRMLLLLVLIQGDRKEAVVALWANLVNGKLKGKDITRTKKKTMYMYSKNFLTKKKLIIQSTQTASPNMLLQKYQGIGERHPRMHFKNF